MKKILIALLLTAAFVLPAQAQQNSNSSGAAQNIVPSYLVIQHNTSLDSIHTLQEKAVEGDADAQFGLGYIFAQGSGVKQDYAEAARWFRKAADQGNVNAQSDLGFIYAQGKGVKQDYEEAAKWFRKAAGKDDAIAQFNLGLLYEKGYGVKQDWRESARWFRKAAEQWKPQE
jgi:TPR repeat protein